MKILFLAHRIPFPPDKGDKIRSFNELCHLARDHSIHLACLVDEKKDLEQLGALSKLCASVSVVYRSRFHTKLAACRALVGRGPLSVAAFRSARLRKKIDIVLRSLGADLIFVYSSSMAEYVREVSGIPKVMDFVDVDSEKWRVYADYHRIPASWVYRLEAKRLGSYEARVAQSFDLSIVASAGEAELLQAAAPGRPVQVVENGVDLGWFTPQGAELREEFALVFTGAMDYFANVDGVTFFCRRVFPAIKAACPQARFYVVGRSPARGVRELARDPRVTVTGWVPDVRPYLAKASIAVAPLRIARGIQNKVLEAMASGLPVVGTRVAFQGTKATENDGVRMAEGPEEFAEKVVALLLDRERQRECSIAARQYVERHHGWEGQCRALEALLEGVVAESSSRLKQGSSRVLPVESRRQDPGSAASGGRAQ